MDPLACIVKDVSQEMAAAQARALHKFGQRRDLDRLAAAWSRVYGDHRPNNLIAPIIAVLQTTSSASASAVYILSIYLQATDAFQRLRDNWGQVANDTWRRRWIRDEIGPRLDISTLLTTEYQATPEYQLLCGECSAALETFADRVLGFAWSTPDGHRRPSMPLLGKAATYFRRDSERVHGGTSGSEMMSDAMVATLWYAPYFQACLQDPTLSWWRAIQFVIARVEGPEAPPRPTQPLPDGGDNFDTDADRPLPARLFEVDVEEEAVTSVDDERFRPYQEEADEILEMRAGPDKDAKKKALVKSLLEEYEPGGGPYETWTLRQLIRALPKVIDKMQYSSRRETTP
jgi:hypothetical protein